MQHVSSNKHDAYAQLYLQFQDALEEIKSMCRRHGLSVGFDHSKPTFGELERRLSEIEVFCGEYLKKLSQ